jgi:hypothetical protein
MEEVETEPNNAAHELHHQIRRGISNTPLQIIAESFNLYVTEEVSVS